MLLLLVLAQALPAQMPPVPSRATAHNTISAPVSVCPPVPRGGSAADAAKPPVPGANGQAAAYAARLARSRTPGCNQESVK